MKMTKLYNNKQCLNEFTVFKYKSVALRVRTVNFVASYILGQNLSTNSEERLV